MSDPLQPLGARPAAVPATATAGTQAGGSFSFHELLSELNPLQYIPVIGTIYRSVTGDVIPESARTLGSLVFSGLTGGPIGLATAAAFLGLERAFGVDREQIGQQVLASLGIGHDTTASTPASGAATDSPSGSEVPQAWSSEQLVAYGITGTGTDTLVNGATTGSDVLNGLVLDDLSRRSGRQSAPALVLTA